MKGLADSLPAIDATYIRLIADPHNDVDCELATRLLYARIEVASTAEALDDMVTRAESREAVQVAAVLALVFGIGLGVWLGVGGQEMLARLFG